MDVDNSIVRNIMIGAHRAGVTPVPIPNTEVKPSIGEDTALRESSTVPNYQRAIRKDGSLAFLGMTLTLRLSHRSVLNNLLPTRNPA